MATRLAWLSTLKASQLKTLAVATGLNSSGTKAFLANQVLTSLQLPKFHTAIHGNGTPHRILSIDMGIRNLAYCVIAIPSTRPPEEKGCCKVPRRPIVEAWDRIAITKKHDATSEVQPKEAFDPATFAQHAYNLVTKLVTDPAIGAPVDILIERQRFRSMGGSAVQEWTLRVNMFEAMLYAVLETLSEKGLWCGKVWPVYPGKVASFWVGNEGGKGKGAKGKEEKIALVEAWLVDGMLIELDGGARAMGEAYLDKRNGRGGMGKGKEAGEEKIGKLDDLADCLLQGMAWVKWEENRRRICENGIDVLNELK